MYSPEQQAHINTLVKEAYARAYAKAEEKYKQVLPDATEVRLAPLQAKLQEAHDALRKMVIESAASSLQAHNPEQVAYLLDGAVKVDNYGALFVIDAEGERRYDRDGAPLSVRAAVADFLAENPHLVKGSTTTGAGSHGGGWSAGQSRTISRRDYERLTPENQMGKIMDGVVVVD